MICDQKGVLLVKFVERIRTMTHTTGVFNVYEGQLKTSKEECYHQALSFFMRMSGAQCSCNKDTPARFQWEVFDHPPYSPNLALSNFYHFAHIKRCIREQHFGTHNKLQTSVENWLKVQVAAFYDKGIINLVPHYKKCLSWSGDYVEK